MFARNLRYLQFAGQTEPEGIHLTLPLDAETAQVLQGWGDNAAYHAQFTYNGVPLKGHPGVDLLATPGAVILSADRGRVIEISNEPGGLGRYVKLDHHWGESLYAQAGEILVETGQAVERGQPIARAEILRRAYPVHLHFAIRVHPYNRFDGWGGFSDPTPFLYVAELTSTVESAEFDDADKTEKTMPPMAVESKSLRRP
jgi:murein DD-endopeptidase MepM/ murein hydrolase activator NlpD